MKNLNPTNILMLKSHSAGIGDILRSSAAWRALKNRYPQAKLNLLFISNNVGYPSEKLISKHHLIDSFYVIDKNWFNSQRFFIDALRESDKVIKEVKPDFIIDFEPYGLETTWVAVIGRFKYKVKTLGINEVFPRGFLYSMYASSVKSFMKKHNIKILNYTDRDFIVLDKLGIERDRIPIEISETEKGRQFRESYRNKFGIPIYREILLVNICCGTPDALNRRVDMDVIENIILYGVKKYNLTPVLMGADFEKQINKELENRLKKQNITVFNLAGETDIEESVGLINDATIFISGDSGPYHIGVALKKPTIAIFNFKEMIETAGHFHPWVKCVYGPSVAYLDEVKEAFDSLYSNLKS
ncbi:MAG: glycosyltransferase family 9 protein [Hydrogenothermaceae bacterium]